MDAIRPPLRERFPAKLYSWVSGRKALIFLALWLLFVILLQFSDQQLVELANGQTKLDLRFGYDLQTVQMLFESYGQQGRPMVIKNLILDTLMPLFLALATILFISLALRKSALVTFLVLIPAGFFFLDILENVLLFILITNFPPVDPNLVRLASAITQPKLIAAILTYGLLILSALIITGRYARDRLTGRAKTIKAHKIG